MIFGGIVWYWERNVMRLNNSQCHTTKQHTVSHHQAAHSVTQPNSTQCHTTKQHTVSHHQTAHSVTPPNSTQCHTTKQHTVSHHQTAHSVTPPNSTQCHTTKQHTVSHHKTTHSVTQQNNAQCHTTRHCVTPPYNKQCHAIEQHTMSYHQTRHIVIRPNNITKYLTTVPFIISITLSINRLERNRFFMTPVLFCQNQHTQYHATMSHHQTTHNIIRPSNTQCHTTKQITVSYDKTTRNIVRPNNVQRHIQYHMKWRTGNMQACWSKEYKLPSIPVSTCNYTTSRSIKTTTWALMIVCPSDFTTQAVYVKIKVCYNKNHNFRTFLPISVILYY